MFPADPEALVNPEAQEDQLDRDCQLAHETHAYLVAR